MKFVGRLIAPVLLSLVSVTGAQAANVTVVISGLGGSEEYTEKFDEYATAIADEAKRIALTETDVILLRGGAAKKKLSRLCLMQSPPAPM